ncbi:hypothetical protein M0811_11736 [Anaeramoeba ignava]|uniref:Uncharacterized protein n=1 Tax=Anaeramoeba ignava TaxID=1746090 RepID=A0A9Q0R796_ANAIG|nr:hypothetical protein M0811_11736 [Anaeramoeba ignava]
MKNKEKENEKEINLGNQETKLNSMKNALQENQKEKDMEWQKELLHLSFTRYLSKSTSYLKNLTLSRIKKKKRNSSEEIVPPQKEKKRSRKSPKRSKFKNKNLISTFLLSKIQPNLFDFENYSLLPTFQIHFKDALEMLNQKETHKQTQKETENSCPNIHDLHIFPIKILHCYQEKVKSIIKMTEIQLLEEDYIHNKREEIKRFLNDLIDNPINLYLPKWDTRIMWWKRWDLEQMLESQDLSIGLVNFLYPQYQNDVEFTRLDFEPTIQKLHQEYKDFQAFKNRRNQIYEDFDKFLEASKKSYPKLIDHFNNFVENRPRMNKIDVFSNWLMSPELRNQIELFESLIEFEKGVDDIIPIIYLTNHHYVCFLIDKQFHKIYLYNTIPKYAKKEVEDMGNHIKQYIKWRINENYEIEELVKKKIQEDGAQCGNSVLLFLWLIFTIKIPIEKAVEIINHSLAVRFRFMILKCICKSTRIQLLFKSPEFIQDIIQNHPKKYRHNSFFLF